MDIISITLSGIPRPKGRPRFGKGRIYTPTSTKSYEAGLKLVVRRAMDGRQPLQGALVLIVKAFLPIPKSWSKKKKSMAMESKIFPTGRPDADNLLKSVDALNGVVWEDDAQVVDARVAKFYSQEPRLEIVVGPMQGGADVYLPQ